MPTATSFPGRFARLLCLGSALLLSACGSGQNWQDQPGYVTVGGTVSGLNGILVLRNGSDSLSLTANGSFRFGLEIANGSAYAVTVATQPAGQFCTVTGGAGTASGDVGGVAVSCISEATVGGTVSGLNGTLVLQNNGSDNLTVTANGTYQFATSVGANRPYAVTVLTQPAGQVCSVANAAGTATANVTNVNISCSVFTLRPLPAIYRTGKPINYSAYRAGGPGLGELPSDADILQDLSLMHQAGFRLLRLFGSDPVSSAILRLAAANYPDMKFQLGMFLQGATLPTCSDPVNNAQIATGIALANQYSNVVTVSVGNETSFANNLPVACLASYVRNVRGQVTQPVTADDDYTFFAGQAANGSRPDEVLPLLDFVSIHTYPISNPGAWDWQQTGTTAGPARAAAMMNASLARAQATYNAVANYTFRDNSGSTVSIGSARPIVIGETGWKARQTNPASTIESYAANPVNAKWFYDLVRGWEAGGTGPVAVFYFVTFDEAWKGIDDGWGLWDAARTARYGLCGTPVGPACNTDLYAGAGFFGTVAPPASYKVLDWKTAGVTYTLTPFGGDAAELTSTGVPSGGATGQVAKITRTAGSQCFAGTTMSVGDSLSIGRLPFSNTAKQITVQLWAPAAGQSVKLKVENANDPAVSVETDQLTTAAGWQTLTFDFSAQSPGTAALNTASTYNKITIFPVFTCGGPDVTTEQIYYVGDITFLGASAPSAPPLGAGGGGGGNSYVVLDFNTSGVNYTLTPFGGQAAELTTLGVPTGGPTNVVAKLTRPVTADCFAGTTMSIGGNFSIGTLPFSSTAKTMTVLFYSPVAGPSIKLKVENAGDPTTSVETDQPAVTGWQTLTFDFAAQSPGTAALNTASTYNKVTIFPAFSCGGTAPTTDLTFYVGPVTFIGAGAPSAPPLP